MGINLEYYWAEDASKIPNSDKDESLISKALGVLQENGVYLLFLFLDSRSEKEKALAKRIKEQLINFLTRPEISILPKGKKYDDKEFFYKELRDLSKDRHRIFFVKYLLEQLLTYARYHAKGL